MDRDELTRMLNDKLASRTGFAPDFPLFPKIDELKRELMRALTEDHPDLEIDFDINLKDNQYVVSITRRF